MTKKANLGEVSNTTDASIVIHVEMDRQTAKFMGYDPEKVSKRLVNGQSIICTLVSRPASLFGNYKREVDRQMKAEARDRKGFVPSEKTEKMVRCEKKCTECQEKNCIPPFVELDAFADDGEALPLNHLLKGDEEMLYVRLFHDILAMLKSIDPRLAYTFYLMYHGFSQKEITRRLGAPSEYWIRKCRAITQKYTSREDFND